MKVLLLEILCFILRVSGIPMLLREFYAKHKVTIINYHDPTPEVLINHVQYYTNKYSFISIDQLIECLKKKNFNTLPYKPLIITFDDGHIGNYKNFAIIKKYKIPITIYAVAGVVNTNRNFWFNIIKNQKNILEKLKKIDDQERRIILEKHYYHYDEKEYSEPSALSTKELKKFIELGGTIGSHTLFHPILNNCSKKVINYECTESKRKLENMLNITINHFSYPNGNYNEKIEKIVSAAGYISSRSTKIGWNIPSTNPFELLNFGISDDASINKAIIQSCGLWDLIKKKFFK